MSHLQSWMTRRRGTLWIPPQLMAIVVAEGWQRFPMETGGVLLGHSTGQDGYVCTVIGPGPHAKHQHTRFEPDSDWQAQRTAEAWHSDRTLEYLGDWHTHP